MVLPRLAAVLVLAVLLGSCTGDENGFDGTTVPVRPEPSNPASGPAVRTLTVGETVFSLHDEGGGCVALTIAHPGLQSTVERACFEAERVLTMSSDCGWLVSSDGDPPEGCHLTLPSVLYGKVQSPDIGYVCIGTIQPDGLGDRVVSARFVSLDESGFILETALPDEVPVAHLFTPGGLRYGMEPLDAPSNPIYQFCSAQAPWGATEYELSTRMFVELGEGLWSDDLIIYFDAGTGPVGLSGGAGADSDIQLQLRAPGSSPGLRVTIDVPGRSPIELLESWPDVVQNLLDSTDCLVYVDVLLTIPDAVLTNPEADLSLRSQSSPCHP